MKIELPKKISCIVSANDKGVKDIIVIATFGVSCKNSYSILINPTNQKGCAELTYLEIIKGADKQMQLALMDFRPIEDVFTGTVVLKIMTKEKLSKASDGYESFKKYYSYKPNHKEDIDQAISRMETIEINDLSIKATAEPPEINLVIG